LGKDAVGTCTGGDNIAFHVHIDFAAVAGSAILSADRDLAGVAVGRITALTAAAADGLRFDAEGRIANGCNVTCLIDGNRAAIAAGRSIAADIEIEARERLTPAGCATLAAGDLLAGIVCTGIGNAATAAHTLRKDGGGITAKGYDSAFVIDRHIAAITRGAATTAQRHRSGNCGFFRSARLGVATDARTAGAAASADALRKNTEGIVPFRNSGA